MDSDFDEDDALFDDYYAMLNLSKNATTEEIQAAYRNFSKMYHPDKHNDENNKKTKAEALFNKIKEAYEILSDSKKRAIYDIYGYKSLQTDDWQLVPRFLSAAEIRAEYEQVLEEREFRRLQLLTNPQSSLTVKLDATEVFNPIDFFDNDGSTDFNLPTLEITGMSVTQSVEVPLTRSNKLLLSGQLATENGKGSGNMMLSWRKLNSPLSWMEYGAGIGVGNGPNFIIKNYQNLPKNVYWNGALLLNTNMVGLKTMAIQPTMLSTFTKQLDTYTYGHCSFSLGLKPNISFTVVRTTELDLINCSVLIGLPHSFLSLNYTRKLLDYELRLRLNTKFGTFGGIIEYGVEKKISKHTNIAAILSVGVPIGVKLKFRFLRGNQIYSFPIQLCDELIPSPIIYGTLIPIILYFATKKLIFKPLFTDEQQKRKSKTFEENLERLRKRKSEAESAIELMTNTYDRIRSYEQSIDGLIILDASYGNELKIHQT